MFFVSLVRWIFQLRRIFSAPDPFEPPKTISTNELDPLALDRWVQSVAVEEDDDSEAGRRMDEH